MLAKLGTAVEITPAAVIDPIAEIELDLTGEPDAEPIPEPAPEPTPAPAAARPSKKGQAAVQSKE